MIDVFIIFPDKLKKAVWGHGQSKKNAALTARVMLNRAQKNLLPSDSHFSTKLQCQCTVHPPQLCKREISLFAAFYSSGKLLARSFWKKRGSHAAPWFQRRQQDCIILNIDLTIILNSHTVRIVRLHKVMFVRFWVL
jgi:hypothetical protein